MITNSRSLELISALKRRILVLDGAMGTAIQNLHLDSNGNNTSIINCNECLNSTHPELVRRIHDEYLQAGCDIIETNTFGGTPLILNEYGHSLGARALELNRLGAQLARASADAYSTPDRPRFVAGSMGSTNKAISITGGISFSELQENFYIQAKGLMEGGVDYFLLETCQDTRNIKAGLLALRRLFEEVGQELPIAVSGTIEPTGTMLAGQTVEALYASLAHLDLLYLGLNCATGPEFMTEAVRSLSALSRFRVACVPNAGLPDEKGCYLETPSMMAHVLSRFVSKGWINLIGGCCGTHRGHIEALVELAAKGTPRQAKQTLSGPHRSILSGIDFLEIPGQKDDQRKGSRPILVGNGINALENEKFKDLISNQKFEEAAEIGRAQVKNGAQILDVCVAIPARDELEDMRMFLEIAVKKVRTPLMIRSSNPKVIELALTYSQGKALVHAGNLPDLASSSSQNGGQSASHWDWQSGAHLARKYGAALVVPFENLENAKNIYSTLTAKFRFPPEDLYWELRNTQSQSSVSDIADSLHPIKTQFPLSKTILTISNGVIDLPAAGLDIAGLDLAIVNPEKLIRDQKTHSGPDPKSLPLMERLSYFITEGIKDGLNEDLNEALKLLKPLEIINGPLMKGMDEVGRLFNLNQLIVAEVLQSAEVMKSAVAYLEKFMNASESTQRGKILLASVQGDVHDIGKNLVEIILANNGFQVINLGIKVQPEQLIQAVRDHHPDIVGLSGLLVKSAQQMVVTAEDLAKAGISVPVLVGGAALSSNFVDRQIAKAYSTGTVAYAQHAMDGLDLAKIFMDPQRFEKFKEDLRNRRDQAQAQAQNKNQAQEAKSYSGDKPRLGSLISPRRSSLVPVLSKTPQPSDFDRHLLRNTPIEQIWNFINPLMLYGRHLGIKGSSVRALESPNAAIIKELEKKDPKALNIWRIVQEVKEEYRGTEIMRTAAVYRFFKVESDGNRLYIYDSNHREEAQGRTPNSGKALCTLDFSRQRKLDGLCLADYVQPRDQAKLNPTDTLAAFVVTVGSGVRQLAELLKNRGDYLKSHIVQALALESAEAYSEMLHSQIRKAWGFPDPPEMTLMERFQAKYRGKRYSFGYPACPRLDDQSLLWQLLQPNEIGVQLTDGFMMDPEASVSALVFHHPAATYFSVGHQSGDESHEDNR